MHWFGLESMSTNALLDDARQEKGGAVLSRLIERRKKHKGKWIFGSQREK